MTSAALTPRANRRRAGLLAFAFTTCLIAGLATAAAISGAIFTSDVDGNYVILDITCG